MKRDTKRWWTRGVTILAVLTVLAATISLGFRLAVDSVPSYRADLERRVAITLGHPTRVGSMALTWSGLRPTLELRDIALLDGQGVALLEAKRLRLGFGLGRLIAGSREPNRIDALGVNLVAFADLDGSLRLQGFERGTDPNRSLTTDLARYEQIRLRDCHLRLHDARLGDQPPLDFTLDQALLRNSGQHLSIDATLKPPAALAGRLSVQSELDGSLAKLDSLSGRWTINVDRIEGWPWLAGHLQDGVTLALDGASLSLDGALTGGHIGSSKLQLRAASLAARQGTMPLAQVAKVEIDAGFEPGSDRTWRLAVSKAAMIGARGPWNAEGIAVEQSSSGEQHFSARRLRLDDLVPWLAVWRELPPRLTRLEQATGDLENLRLTVTPAEIDAAPRKLSLNAVLTGVGLTSSLEQTGFAGLNGELEADADHGLIRLAGTPLELHLPAMFDLPVPLTSVDGELRWQREAEAWRIDSQALTLKLGSSEVSGEIALSLHPEKVPDLKLRLNMHSADVATLKPWMPKTWGEGTRAWLDRALRTAKVASGELKIDAPMTPRDAENHTTMPWTLRLAVTDAVLAYSPDWPVVEGGSAELRFHDGGLDIAAEAGSVSGLAVTQAKASIENFFAADLVLDGRIDGDAVDFYQLFRDSPLRTRLSGLLARTEASGPASASLQLRVPLHVPQPPVDASGTLTLDQATVTVRGMSEPLRGVSGQLAYGRSIAADLLTARLFDTAITARIQPDPGSPDPVLLGDFQLAPGRNDGLAAAYVPAWLRSGLEGPAGIHLRLPLAGPDNGRLSLSSDLRGVTSTLPLPLTKTADAALPVQIELATTAGVTRLGIRAADDLQVGVRYAEVAGSLQTRGVEAHLGKAQDKLLAPLADAEGLVLNGEPSQLDLGAWIGLLTAAASGDGGLRLRSADVTAARVGFGRWTLGKTHLVALPDGDGIGVRADGAASGTVQWQPANGGQVLARFQALAVEALPPLPPTQPGEEPADSPFNPQRAPTFDLEADRLSLGEVNLGHLIVSTARVSDGQRIDKLSLEGGHLDASASGFWLRRPLNGVDASSADLRFDVRSDAISDVLKVFGYAPNLSAEKAHFSGALVWPRVPTGLALSQAEGKVDIDLESGSLKAVEPGAGRVLGLVNLYALPRRLLFDFRDVVADGLGFDNLDGSFALAAGNAVTDNLKIVGPSLKVELRGRIGLAAHDYDQQVTVYPDISTGVTVGATLLGGPIAGGILLVAQQLFDKPFNRLSKFSYRVTGSWDDPKVLKGVEEVRPAAASEAAPATVKTNNG